MHIEMEYKAKKNNKKTVRYYFSKDIGTDKFQTYKEIIIGHSQLQLL